MKKIETCMKIGCIVFLTGRICAPVFVGTLSAQPTIGLQAALDSAKSNNLSLRNEELKVEYQKLLQKTSLNIPQALLFSENGQINSRYIDNRFGISQSINFPTVYTRRKNLFDQEYTLASFGFQLKELELKRQVLSTYYHLLYLQQKEQILLKNDSLYAVFLEKSSLRLKTGQSDILEKSFAEIYRNQVAMNLRALQEDKLIYLMQLQWLLNTKTRFEPFEHFKIELPPIDSGMMARHPQLLILWQEKQIRLEYTQLEKSKLLPDLNLTYSNMSMYGIGADNRFYNRNSRFQSFQLGIGIPVFSGAQRSIVMASKSQEKIAENNYLVAVYSFNNHWQQAIALYRKHLVTLEYFETSGLRNVDLLIEAANQQFDKGEINYLSWATLINQALAAKSEYLDAVNNNNEAVIELIYLMGQ